MAMYQPPYKQLYSRSAKRVKHKTPVQKKTVRGVVRAADLIDNELDLESPLSTKFHIKARNGSLLVK